MLALERRRLREVRCILILQLRRLTSTQTRLGADTAAIGSLSATEAVKLC